MRIFITPLTFAAVALTTGCATSRPANFEALVDTPPREIACADKVGLRSTVPRTSIELRYEVNTDGKVGGVRPVQNLNSNYASDAEISAAVGLAHTCFYEPATKGGQPVVASVSRWFTIERR